MKSLLIRALGTIAPHYLWRLRAEKWTRGQQDEKELQLLPALCDTRKLSVDVGASMGLYTMHLLGYSSGCVSFEPRPLHAAELNRMFAGSRPPVRVEQMGLSDHVGSAFMRVVDSDLGRSTIEPENTLRADDAVHEERIAIRTLDAYQLQNVGFIKIDVEGHEEAVVRGALQTIRQNLPSLLIEMEERHKPGTIDRMRRLLDEFSYQGYFLDGARLRSIDESASAGNTVNNFVFLQPPHVARLRHQHWTV
jgi:FkbM family methyltransferase